MYAVQCPHCQQWLKVNREAHQARFKCSGCERVFDGSTQAIEPADEAMTQAAQLGRVAAPPSRLVVGGASTGGKLLRRGRGKPIVAVVVALVLAAILIPLIIFAAVYGGKTHFYSQDPRTGEITDHGWLRQEEIARIKKAQNDAAREAARGPRKRTRYVEAQTPANAAARSPASTPADANPPPRSDPKIEISAPTKYPDESAQDGARGYLTGTVRNLHDRVLADVTVTVQLRDKHGRVLAEPSATLQWVPPKCTLHYSVRYQGDYAKALPYALATPAGEDVVGWVIQMPTVERTDKSITVSGRVKNANEFSTVEIYVDFIREQGIFERTMQTSVTDPNTRLFRLVFDANDTGSDPARIRTLVTRVIATK